MRKKTKDNKAFQDALYGMSTVLRSWSIKLQKCANQIHKAKKGKNSQQQIEIFLSEIDFQTAAFSVCEKLRNFLKPDNPDDVYITVYQKYEDSGKKLCRMIAYSSDHEPTSKDDIYEIPLFSPDLFGNIEYHTYLFSSGKKDICVLQNPDDIRAAFSYHTKSEEREKNIKQYIGIPIAPSRQGVVFLLQVDTVIDNYFGDSVEATLEFAKNTIYPYAQFLHMIYEESRTIIQFLD